MFLILFDKLREVLFLVLICCFIAACGSDANDGSDTVTPEDAPHDFGSLWAMHYPSSIGGYAADHTYLVAQDEDDIQHEWPCFSLTPGVGKELSNTRSEVSADLTVADFMANESPCKWPLSFYLRIGICYQCANRGLYFTNKTVSDAQGYTYFVTLYGTYGNDAYDTYSLNKCIDAAPQWQGEALERQMPMIGPGQDLSDLSISDMEIALYEQFFGENGAIHRGVADRPQLHRSYLDALFSQIIKQKLGADFPPATASQLQQARNDFLDGKQELEQWAQDAGYQSSEVIDEYRRLFEELDANYKAILTPDQYEALFNLDYKTPLDIRLFLPN